MKDKVKELIKQYEFRLEQTVELSSITKNEMYKDVIDIQINIYNAILNDLDNLL